MAIMITRYKRTIMVAPLVIAMTVTALVLWPYIQVAIPIAIVYWVMVVALAGTALADSMYTTLSADNPRCDFFKLLRLGKKLEDR